MHGTVIEAAVALRLAYQVFANTAEIELVDATGCATDNFRFGLRGSDPTLVHASIVHTPKTISGKQTQFRFWASLETWCKQAHNVLAKGSSPFGFVKFPPLPIAPPTHLCGQLTAAFHFASGLSSVGLATDILGQEFAEFKAQLSEQADLAALDAEAEDNSLFDTFMEEAAANNGSKGLFRLGRLPAGWIPPVVAQNGRLTAAPDAVLLHEVNTLRKHWQISDCPAVAIVPDRCHLPPASTEELRRVSRCFSHGTSCSLDGMHPRHPAMLCDDALPTLSDIIVAMEAIGMPPPQLSYMSFPLVDKPGGGYRAILSQPALVRNWEGLRKPLAQSYVKANDRPYWGLGKSRSPESIIFTQAARIEAGVADPEVVAVAVQLDGIKYYEGFDILLLAQRYIETGGEPVLGKFCRNYWRTPRLVKLQNNYSSLISFSGHGLPAGSMFNNAMVVAYALEAFDHFCIAHPAVQLLSFVDDDNLAVIQNRKTATGTICEATFAFAEMFKDKLKLGLNYDKLTSVATCPIVARQVTQKLASLAGHRGSLTTSVPSLGIDLAMPGKRPRGTKRKTRFAKLASLAKRYARVRKWLPRGKHRIGRLYQGAMKPSVAFGAPVNGLNDLELHKLRAHLLKAHKPNHGGVSFTLRLAVIGDPCCKEALAPAYMWAKLVWQALCAPIEAMPCVRELVTMWSSVFDHIDYEPTWANSRGPLSRVCLSLERIGWKATSAFEWEDHEGQPVHLGKVAPRMIFAHMQSAMSRSLEINAAKYLGNPELGGRLCCAQLSKLFRGRGAKAKHYDGWTRFVMLAAPCRALYCRDELIKMGYLSSDLCPLCGTEKDSLYHRVWKCSHVDASAARQAAAPARYRDWAAAEPTQICWSTGHFEHPAIHWPNIPVKGNMVLQDIDGSALDLANHCFDYPFVVPDGSAMRSVIPECSRAAWAVVFLDSEQTPKVTLQGPVWRGLTQTSQSAEHVGLAICSDLQAASFRAYVDCKSVVDISNMPPDQQLSPALMHAGIRRSAMSHVGHSLFQGTQHIKAHRSLAAIDLLPVAEKALALANCKADILAKDALRVCGLLPPPVIMQDTDLALEKQRVILETIAAVLSVFPKEDILSRLPPLTSEEKAARKEARTLDAAKAKLALAHANSLHAWHLEALGWVCTRCLSNVDSRVSESMLAKGGCRPSEALRYLRLNPLDHDLYSARIVSSHKLHGGGKQIRVASSTDILVLCQTCGLYAEELLRLLKKPCDGPPIITRRSQNLAKIARLLHPSDKLRALETVRPLGTWQKILGSRKRNAAAIATVPLPPGLLPVGIPTRRLRSKTHIAATLSPSTGDSDRGLCLVGTSSAYHTSMPLLGLAPGGIGEAPTGATVGCFGLSSSSSCGDGAIAVSSRKIPLGGALASVADCKAVEPNFLVAASCHFAADADIAMGGLSSTACPGDGATAVVSRKIPQGGASASVVPCHGTTAVAFRKIPLGGARASAVECKAVEPNFPVAASCLVAADAGAAMGGQGCLDCPEFRDEFGMFDVDDV